MDKVPTFTYAFLAAGLSRQFTMRGLISWLESSCFAKDIDPEHVIVKVTHEGILLEGPVFFSEGEEGV